MDIIFNAAMVDRGKNDYKLSERRVNNRKEGVVHLYAEWARSLLLFS